jgi:hypothetical protein
MTAPVDRATSLSVTQTAAIRRKLTEGTTSILDLVRAFAVTVWPSVVLDGAARAGVASTVHALARRRRPPGPAVLATALVAAYLAAVRPWMLHWGATTEETHKPLPGDELVPNPGSQSTRAVTVNAAVEAVWPWLAQVGQDRAGFESRWRASRTSATSWSCSPTRPGP